MAAHGSDINQQERGSQMALIARKLQGPAHDRVRRFVAQHAHALEPGLSVLETSLRLGRATIDVVALDAKQTLVLVVAGEVADERMLISTLDAYVWCLVFPDNLRRLYPTAEITMTRPPRVIFVAERIPDAFLELVERLSVVPVECQELASPAAAPTTGSDERPVSAAAPVPPALPVAPLAPAPAAPMVPGMPVAPVLAAPTPAGSQVPTATPSRLFPVAAGSDAAVAHQWESFLSDGTSTLPVEPAPGAPLMVEVPVMRGASPASHVHADGSGHPNGHSGSSSNGNGHTSIPASATPQPVSSSAGAGAVGVVSVEPRASAPPMTEIPVIRMATPAAPAGQWPPTDPHRLASDAERPAASRSHAGANGHPAPVSNGQASMGAAEACVEHAAVDLGAPRVTDSRAATQPGRTPFKSATPPQPAKPVAPSQVPESPTVSHPALESLKFPKGGVSRQWQDFLDQLAANQ